MSEKHRQKHILATTTEKHNLYSTKQTDNSKLTLIYCRLPAKCKEPRQIDSQSNIVRVEFVYAERNSQLPPQVPHTNTHTHFIQAFHLCVLRTTRHDNNHGMNSTSHHEVYSTIGWHLDMATSVSRTQWNAVHAPRTQHHFDPFLLSKYTFGPPPMLARHNN